MNRSMLVLSLLLLSIGAACQKEKTPEEREASVVPSGAASGSEMPKTVVLANDPEASTAKFHTEGGAQADASGASDTGAAER